MAGLPSSYIAPDVLNEAQAIDENALTPPDGADVVGTKGQKGYRASWTETLDITKVETNPSQKGNGWWVITVQFTVAPDLAGFNAGRPAWQRFMLYPAAAGNRSHEYFNLHMKALARMANLLRAVGLIGPEDGFDPPVYFDNPETDLLNKRVAATVTQYVKRNGDPEQEIAHFTPAAS